MLGSSGHDEVRYIGHGMGEFSLIFPWKRPMHLPDVMVTAGLGLDRLFYPLYNLYLKCGRHGVFNSYARFWHSRRTRHAIALRIDDCIENLAKVATEYEMEYLFELNLARNEVRLYVISLNIPPGKNPRIVKLLSETLVQTANCLLQSASD